MDVGRHEPGDHTGRVLHAGRHRRSVTLSGSSTSDFGTLGNELFVPLNDGVDGTALWVTDGTAAGTTMLAQRGPSSLRKPQRDRVLPGHQLLLIEIGLWKTDGTAAGTSEVKISPARAVHIHPVTNQLAVANGKLFFTTSDGNEGVDLWVSDGTQSGTVIVKDFAKPSGSSTYELCFGVGADRLRRQAGLRRQRWHPWLAGLGQRRHRGRDPDVDDGQRHGEQRLPVRHRCRSQLAHGRGRQALFLRVYSRHFDKTLEYTQGLWSSDGTPGGTTEFETIPTFTAPVRPPRPPARLSNLTAVGSNLYFSVTYNNYDGNTDVERRTSSGRVAGRPRTRQVVPVPATGSPFTSLSNFNAVGSTLLFEAVESSGDTELWASNGTATGTTLLKVLNPSSENSDEFTV